MLEKIKMNFKYIMLIGAFVSIGLLIPSIFALFSSELSDSTILSLIYYCGIIIANIFILTKANKNVEEVDVTIPLILICVSKIISYVNGLYNNQYINIAYIALYLAIIILYFIKNNKKVLLALYVLLALSISFTMLNIFTGSQVGLSIFISLVLVTILIILQRGKGEEK